MKHKQVKTKIPDTWRNSPVLWPYRFTECSKAFLSVEPFSCTRSKVPPKGKTEIRSSMVMEPTVDAQHRFKEHTQSQRPLRKSRTESSPSGSGLKRATHRFGCAHPQTCGCLLRWRWRRWRGSTGLRLRIWCCCWPERWRQKQTPSVWTDGLWDLFLDGSQDQQMDLIIVWNLC